MHPVRRFAILIGVASVASVACTFVAGCSKPVTAANAAPVMAENRAEMIKWHQQHDKKPVMPSQAN